MKTIRLIVLALLFSGCYSKYESYPEYHEGKWRWSEPKQRPSDQTDWFKNIK